MHKHGFVLPCIRQVPSWDAPRPRSASTTTPALKKMEPTAAASSPATAKTTSGGTATPRGRTSRGTSRSSSRAAGWTTWTATTGKGVLTLQKASFSDSTRGKTWASCRRKRINAFLPVKAAALAHSHNGLLSVSVPYDFIQTLHDCEERASPAVSLQPSFVLRSFYDDFFVWNDACSSSLCSAFCNNNHQTCSNLVFS